MLRTVYLHAQSVEDKIVQSGVSAGETQNGLSDRQGDLPAAGRSYSACGYHHAGTDQGFRSLLYPKRPSGACDTGAVRSNGLFERALGVIETI